MSEHPADALKRFCKQAGWEADPEALAEIRAICDAPVDTTNPHEAMREWAEREYEKVLRARLCDVIESKVVTAVCSTWAGVVRAGGDPRADVVCLDTACPIHKTVPQ